MYNQDTTQLWTELAKLPCVSSVFAHLIHDTDTKSIKEVLALLVQLVPHLSILLDSQVIVLFKLVNEPHTEYGVPVAELPSELRQQLFNLVQESRSNKESFESLTKLNSTELACAQRLENYTQLNLNDTEIAFSVFFENVLIQLVQSVPQELLLEVVGNIQAVLRSVRCLKNFQRVSFQTFLKNCIDPELLN